MSQLKLVSCEQVCVWLSRLIQQTGFACMQQFGHALLQYAKQRQDMSVHVDKLKRNKHSSPKNGFIHHANKSV